MNPYRCFDRMCGADDCPNCHPENYDAQWNYRYADSADGTSGQDRDNYTDTRDRDNYTV